MPVLLRRCSVPVPASQLVRCLSQTVCARAICDALDATEKREKRRRRLPASLVVQLVIALGILADMATRQVLRSLLAAGGRLPDRKSLSDARYRLGARPLIALFAALCRPLATPAEIPAAFHRGMRLVALDAVRMNIPDSPDNEKAFGRPSASRGKSAFPQVKVIGLVEVGTHATLGAAVRPWRRHEAHVAPGLIEKSVGPDMLLLWDRGFFGYPVTRACRKRGAHFLGRAKKNAILTPEERLSDGSFLATMYPSDKARRRDKDGIRVRVIDYRVGANSEVIRLVTSLLDWRLDPAETLAGLYHERWEIELVFDEVKTHQQGRPNGQRVAIRAQRPSGVVQEIYGLLLAHRAVRTFMAAAAAREAIDPDRLSFKNALVIVRRELPGLAQSSRRSILPLCPAF